MLIKFLAKTMPRYAGMDGLGGSITAKENDVIEVSETVGQLLMRVYGNNFEIVIKEKPQHAPKIDKLHRRTYKTKTT